MTDHVFKVGDRGKTRGQEGEPETQRDYDITAVGEDYMLVKLFPHTPGEISEIKYLKNGREDICGFHESAFDLLPPKRRIQGWFNWFSNNAGHLHIDGPYEDKEAANIEARRYKVICVGAQRIACIYIDTEEGEGL